MSLPPHRWDFLDGFAIYQSLSLLLRRLYPICFETGVGLQSIKKRFVLSRRLLLMQSVCHFVELNCNVRNIVQCIFCVPLLTVLPINIPHGMKLPISSLRDNCLVRFEASLHPPLSNLLYPTTHERVGLLTPINVLSTLSNTLSCASSICRTPPL